MNLQLGENEPRAVLSHCGALKSGEYTAAIASDAWRRRKVSKQQGTTAERKCTEVAQRQPSERVWVVVGRAEALTG